MKAKRTGSITLGIMLVVFGILFLLRTITPNLNFITVLRFWPLVFIFLGGEILFGYFLDKEGTFRYDTGSIVMLILLMLFAMFMGGMEWYIENAPIYLF